VTSGGELGAKVPRSWDLRPLPPARGRADHEGMNFDSMRTVPQFAALAPSVHNTQPWQFVVNGHSLEVRADANRALRQLDPAARQLHISCGAAVEFARLGVRSLGYSCIVRLAPRADDPLLLATLTIGHRHPASPEERRLIEAIPRRYTDRGPYDTDIPVSDSLLARLRDAANERGCWLRVLDRPGDRLTAATLLYEAESAEMADQSVFDELARWRRDEGSEDGIPDSALGEPHPAGVVTDLPLRDFTGQNRHPQPGGDGPPPQVERDTIVLLGSDSDDPHSWLRSGRALGHLLLVLTDAGLVSQPLGPVTDIPATRIRLQRELGLLGHPQLMLRLGYGHGRPRSGRRDVDKFLTVAALP
jgi:nitroreductase